MTETFEPLEGLQGDSFVKGSRHEDVGADTAAQVFVLDLQEAVPGVVRMRDWARSMLAPQPGETVVDVGSGNGTEVRRMAALVGPAGRAVGVDPHDGLRATATERSVGTSATFVDGDATALPFPDDSVDVLTCERVFQHLPDPEAAVREFARVLRPGGRVVIIDSDWGTMVVMPGDPGVLRRIDDHRHSTTPNPFSGRRLVGQLRRAGFRVDPDVAATAVVPPGGALLVLMRTSADEAVAAGAVTRDEADRLLADLSAAVETGEAFAGVTMFGVVGRL
ncbi:MAG TPA: methyltransferase domain-containing protein [Nocardioides sp.]|nr:methyltransferase domain-containing protein [Nocardioides sp.]